MKFIAVVFSAVFLIGFPITLLQEGEKLAISGCIGVMSRYRIGSAYLCGTAAQFYFYGAAVLFMYFYYILLRIGYRWVVAWLKARKNKP